MTNDDLRAAVERLADEWDAEADRAYRDDLGIAARQVRRTSAGQLRQILAAHAAPSDAPQGERDEVCGCPDQQYDLHRAEGCRWFPPIRSTEGAKERVARRKALRTEAAAAGRLLPSEYRENLRRQFERAGTEARFIVGEHTPPAPAPVADRDAGLSDAEKSYGRTDPGLQMRGRWYSEASVERILAARMAALTERLAEVEAERDDLRAVVERVRDVADMLARRAEVFNDHLTGGTEIGDTYAIAERHLRAALAGTGAQDEANGIRRWLRDRADREQP